MERSGRTVPLHPEARAALSVWLGVLAKRLSPLDASLPVFCSRVKDPATGRRKAISKEAFAANELTGTLGIHVMRKAFANRMHEKLNRDLVKVQRAMGPRHINSTVSYVSVREEAIADAILAA
jgi:integrase